MKKVVAKLMLGILAASLFNNNLMGSNVVYASEQELLEIEESEFTDTVDYIE